MAITEKLKWIVLPSLLVIGLGTLEINFPHAMDGFDDGYTGTGVAGFIMLLFELFLMLTWGKVGGTFAILLGMLAIVICLLPNMAQTEEQPTDSLMTENEKRLITAALSSLALRAGKTYVQKQLRNRRNRPTGSEVDNV